MTTMYSILVLLTSFVSFSWQYNVTVLTNNGYVKGYTGKSSLNSSVLMYVFRGVPYGEPPVGPLRFQDPQPVSSWEGVKETKSYAESCAAHKSGTSGSPIIGNEDCLYLNIYVHYSEKDNYDLSMPVMVWIHGGAFVRGTPFANVATLIEKPMIVVVIAYRLGVLGFLNTMDENAWGNAGLKDQNLALRWIKDNIKHFGGDPNKITIFGQSAGGASIQYHLVSPKSQGLFSQAISQSGSTLNEWGFLPNPRELTFEFAELFNISTKNTKDVVEALQKIDYETLIEKSLLVDRFLPSVEANHPGALMDRSTYEIWSQGEFNKVPVIIGYTSEEGSYGKGRYKQYAKDPQIVIPAGLNLEENSPLANEIVEKISDIYFPNNSYENFTKCIDFMTQHYFVRGIRKTVADLVKSPYPVYFYKFSYVTTEDYTKGANGGAGHGEDNMYILYNNLTTEADILTRKRMVTMWTNFVTYGNPTPEKDPILGNITWLDASAGHSNEDDVNYLEIGTELIPGINPDQTDYLFWKKIFENYSSSEIFTY